jgi:hypothetical protein
VSAQRVMEQRLPHPLTTFEMDKRQHLQSLPARNSPVNSTGSAEDPIERVVASLPTGVAPEAGPSRASSFVAMRAPEVRRLGGAKQAPESAGRDPAYRSVQGPTPPSFAGVILVMKPGAWNCGGGNTASGPM